MKPKIAVHKFSSCDGCQLAFLNLGEELLTLFELADVLHFAEAGPVDADAGVDISFVEGSISSPQELVRIKRIRERSRYLVTIGACATAGGLQALRNMTKTGDWLESVYPAPEYIQTLESVSPVHAHVEVDLELWGCPVNSRQVLAVIPALLSGVIPADEHERVCMECKRQQGVCVMVTRGLPCMGPVTRTGCGALCPRIGRDCYGCYGPSETPATGSLSCRFAKLGLDSGQIAHRFHSFNPAAPAFHRACLDCQESDD
ncbi:MAG: sulfhydrogenase subunit delta [Pseudomonadota bacterium]|nr:sulfhydrogenase subunit delta [Pseudomonadota bacterium]